MPPANKAIPFKQWLMTQDALRAFVGALILLAVVTSIVLSLQATHVAGKVDQGVEQIKFVARVARNFAEAQADFGLRPGEDMLATLTRLGQMQAEITAPTQRARLTNLWDGALRASITTPSIMRIETQVPASECRHISAVFAANPRAYFIHAMAAQGIPFYNEEDHKPISLNQREANCGAFGNVILTLDFKLR